MRTFGSMVSPGRAGRNGATRAMSMMVGLSAMTEQSRKQTALVKLYGKVGSAATYAIRDFLYRCDIPFEFIPASEGEAARQPICEFPDGTRLVGPSIRQITEKLGWFRNPSRTEYELAIYGGGPAGLSAA